MWIPIPGSVYIPVSYTHLQKAALIKEKAPGRAKGIQSSEKTDFNTSEAADKAADLERNILTFQADIANTILTGLEQYDTYAEIFYNRPVPCEPHMTKAVSYTHLDVYKRQIMVSAANVQTSSAKPADNRFFTNVL